MATHVDRLLGTVADVSVSGRWAVQSRRSEQRVITEIRRLEAIFTLFDPASDLNRYRTAGTTEVPELVAVLALAAEWELLTAGAFSPATEGFRSLWTDAERNQQVPLPETITSVLQRADDASSTNLNGIAKGWIVDRAIETSLQHRRKPDACWVSIGGDVAHRGAGSINVGIEDPFRPYDNAEPSQQVELSNQALATSGGARRYWKIAGETYSHVIDPRTGQSVDHVASASVIAADAASADALATAATVLEPHESIRLVNTIDGAACLIVTSDRVTHRSTDWPG